MLMSWIGLICSILSMIFNLICIFRLKKIEKNLDEELDKDKTF